MFSLNEFYDLYPNPRTAGGYRTALIHFFALIYDCPKQGRAVTSEELEEYDRLSRRYLAEERDHAADLMRFALAISNRPPKTAKYYMAAVNQFCIENDIEVSQRARKRIRRRLPAGGAQTIERELTRDTLKEILLHMDTHGRALCLLLVSSGMRIGEALKIHLTDIDLEDDPPTVTIPGPINKNRQPRVTFLSQEAAGALRAWLQVRDQYIVTSANRNAGIRVLHAASKTLDDPRLFPFSYSVVTSLWANALTKSGHYSLDRTTGRRQIHPHMLRKYFLSQFAGNNTKHGEELAGHAGYLTDAYRRIPRAELAAEYKKVEPRLNILAPADYGELNERDRATLQRQAEIIARLAAEKDALESRLISIEGDVRAMREFEAEIRRELQAEP